MGTIIIIKLFIIRITYSRPITLITAFITATTAIIVIIAYIVAFSLGNANINIITVFISIITGARIVFIKIIFNTIINNGFIDYTN